ncbi:hypothetical protein M5K25_003879 [Dendrobium thyrsiflorum]|uniref:Uncharacterized protein n=1 Tax=Dendrobium thyrsiflorum TaxID=117978 RepID=A0ABD0VKC6_DENTH
MAKYSTGGTEDGQKDTGEVALAERRNILEAKTKEDKLASFPRRREEEVDQARKLFQRNQQVLHPKIHHITYPFTLQKHPLYIGNKEVNQQPQLHVNQKEKGKGKGQRPSTELPQLPTVQQPSNHKGHGKPAGKRTTETAGKGRTEEQKQAPRSTATKPHNFTLTKKKRGRGKANGQAQNSHNSPRFSSPATIKATENQQEKGPQKQLERGEPRSRNKPQEAQQPNRQPPKSPKQGTEEANTGKKPRDRQETEGANTNQKDNHNFTLTKKKRGRGKANGQAQNSHNSPRFSSPATIKATENQQEKGPQKQLERGEPRSRNKPQEAQQPNRQPPKSPKQGTEEANTGRKPRDRQETEGANTNQKDKI